MRIKRVSVAGTLESSDIMVTVSPDTTGIQIELMSSVEKYYGDSIQETIRTVLHEMGVKTAAVKATDRGALDCTIRARVTTAVRRASAEEETAK
ncbi:citrate lyase acyl carrier protein [Oscillospiraceae bacterium LTW-04]|nr:citrate lyase acyl carrier protein [Oscillospiraceae bacterium MB24-C1]